MFYVMLAALGLVAIGMGLVAVVGFIKALFHKDGGCEQCDKELAASMRAEALNDKIQQIYQAVIHENDD